MTLLEKWKEDNPKAKLPNGIMPIGCPFNFGYEQASDCKGMKCVECWNREMPNTELVKTVTLPMPPNTEPLTEKEKMIDAMSENAYNKGLNDAWELVRKLYDMKCDEFEKIFGVGGCFYEIIRNYTPQEALAKLKAYEEAQNKIEIGDVVVDLQNQKGIVVGFLWSAKKVDVWFEGYGRPQEIETRFLTKTGKKVELSSILEQIGE